MIPGEFRVELLQSLERTATVTLLEPERPHKPVELVTALVAVHDAYERLVVATSHSNRGFEARDLPVAEQALRKKVKHVLSLLDNEYVEPTREKDGSR